LNQPQPAVSLPFDIYIQAAPAKLPEPKGFETELNGAMVCPLDLQADDLKTMLAMQFEESVTYLDTLPRMFIEPDGSFVQRGDGWQIDGVLHDSPAGLTAVECRGAATQQSFDALLAVAGWPQQGVVFQLTRTGVFLPEPAFRKAFRL